MKLIFFSSDRSEVEQLEQDLLQGGIACKVRSGVPFRGVSPHPPEAELWIENDQDCSRAFLFCVKACLGFAKHKNSGAMLDPWYELLGA